ncbi:hypothetical protein K443DRAFT_887 [Laccaria amethystina LaAM-08-1]|uniref:Uncharacterized protein n=1 Tax=Laccaria amethystina LaAM-08-1 TaxID=1095629 RepID=A0A0C9YFN4_9AGAR|nr:hypothetical protein K443DRAFT_887 [Laccaria amethystina LaAM-08-1]
MYSVNNDPFFCQPGEATELQGSSQSYPIESNRQDAPIVSPVPLPYSAQSTAVLRRMISATQDTNSSARALQSDDLGELWTDDHPVSSYTPPSLVYPEDVQESSLLPSSPFQPSDATSNVLRLITIRPITPGTLMALTEPCLMAWCGALDCAPTDDLCQPLCLPTSGFLNSWGY